MKILFICENYLPHYGGAEVVFKNLAEGYVQRGHQVSLITHQLLGTKKKEEINGVEVNRIPSFHSRYVFTFSALLKAIKFARRQDIIQTTTFNGAFPAWLAARWTGKPVVLTVHEVWVGKWQEVTGFSWLKSKIHEFLEKLIYLLPFDKYICVSEATKKDLLKLGIHPEKVEVIYNGLDDNFWAPSKVNPPRVREIKKEFGSRFVYFSWGRPGESKGFEYILEAVPLIVQKIPHSLFLLMLGSVDKYPQKYQEILGLVKKINLPNNIKLIASRPDSELRDYLWAVDGVVVPSLAEGFGYTAVQAVAMDKPLVVSDAGALPEVVGGRYQIFKSKDVQDLAEKVVKIARKEYLQQEQKRFLWDESINCYLKVYLGLRRK